MIDKSLTRGHHISIDASPTGYSFERNQSIQEASTISPMAPRARLSDNGSDKPLSVCVLSQIKKPTTSARRQKISRSKHIHKLPREWQKCLPLRIDTHKIHTKVSCPCPCCGFHTNLGGLHTNLTAQIYAHSVKWEMARRLGGQPYHPEIFKRKIPSQNDPIPLIPCTKLRNLAKGLK